MMTPHGVRLYHMEFSATIKDNLQKYCTALPSAGNAEWLKSFLANWREQAVAEEDSGLKGFMEALEADPQGKQLLTCLFGNSPYLSLLLLKEPSFLKEILEKGYATTFADLMDSMQRSMDTLASREEVMVHLRLMKRRIALLTALADISGRWQLERVTSSLSQFADMAVRTTIRYLLRDAVRSGTISLPDEHDPEKGCGLIVIAMGKMGAYELNYSSDIDLIVFYDEQRLSYSGRQTVGQFFIRLTQEMVTILQDRTHHGYVFRTDLRLRPDPGSNPVAVSIHNAGMYYETLGQNWERAAMIKSRIVVGDEDTARLFHSFITPYIWRRSLDFASIQDIHSIKRQIDSRQGKLPDHLYNYHVKLGPGGIREVEFFAQTQQLIWGGRQPKLRCKATCDAIRALVELGEVHPDVCENLISAYRFYRTVEHRLQMIEDQQTHTLPDTPEKMQQVAVFLGYTDSRSFVEELEKTIATVQEHYSHLFENSPSLASNDPEIGGSLVFTGTEEDPATLATLRGMGFTEVESISATIRGWHHGRYRAMRTKRARELLTELMPVLLKAFSKSTEPDTAFLKFDEFLSKLPAGVQIFSLFYANPNLLDLIAEIMGSYPYIANNLSHNPSLLDYVLIPRFYNIMRDILGLKESLGNALAEAHDLQDVVEATRLWTSDHRFRVGIQCIKKTLSFQQAARHLTDIAEASIDMLMDRVQADFSKQHGTIPKGEFAILGMGKLGGKEMTFSSDLDLVFVYDVPDSHTLSNGITPLPASEYYARLSRRLVNALTALTPQGTLYEVDLRLRPSGQDGPVVSYLHAFEEYYQSSAWAWEHMALTRARVIYGSPDFRNRVGTLIHTLLRMKRDKPTLVRHILDMHTRLRKAYPVSFTFRVKHVPGGLVDLEYIAQYLQLVHAANHPDILDTGTTTALKNIAEAGLVDKESGIRLVEAAVLFTEVQGAMRLIGARKADETTLTPGIKRTIAWHVPCKNFEELEKRLETAQKNVQKLFHDIIIGASEERS